MKQFFVCVLSWKAGDPTSPLGFFVRGIVDGSLGVAVYGSLGSMVWRLYVDFCDLVRFAALMGAFVGLRCFYQKG